VTDSHPDLSVAASFGRTVLSPEVAALLVVVALFAGVGITAVGPGGVFVTIALFALSPLDSAAVAGTASATFVATGVVGAAAYLRSGEFATGFAREAALAVSASSVVGALAGTRLNLSVSERTFGLALAAFVAVVGALILIREYRGVPRGGSEPTASAAGDALRGPRWRRAAILSAVGLGVGIGGGMLGVGGPVVAVPVLVVLGVPMLVALAVAQVQSVFISGFATLGYLSVDAVSWPLVALVGVPQLVGVVVGWRVAHRVEAGRLRVALGCTLLVVAPLMAP